MRLTLAVATLAALALVTVHGRTQNPPLRQDVEVLTAGPTRIEQVKDGLYVIRGPFVPCGTRGCRPGGPDDGLIHEPGDVAARVTPEGVILVDDKYPEISPTCWPRCVRSPLSPCGTCSTATTMAIM